MRPRGVMKSLSKTLYKRYMNNKIKKLSLNNDIRKTKLRKSDKTKILEYWNPYRSVKNFAWHKAYKSIFSTDSEYNFEKFIPEDIFYMEIEPNLNNLDIAMAYEDKNYYHKIFSKEKMPKILFRNMNGFFYDQEYNELSLLKINEIHSDEEGKSYIVKPSLDTHQGRNVNKIIIKNGDLILNGKNYSDLSILNEMYGNNYLIQEMISQHSLLSSIYKHSLNTIRVVTLRTDNGVKFISAVIRFGSEKRIVDNRGISCGINNEGIINSYGTNLSLDKCYRHPYTNESFSGVQIPHFNKLKDFVIEMHNELIYFDMISWDIAIDEKGDFKMIEYNLNKQEINFHQINNGPLFGRYTDAVLERVYK